MPSPKTCPKNGKLHIEIVWKTYTLEVDLPTYYPCSHRHELHDHRRIRQMDAAGHIDFTRLWSVVLVRLDPIKKIDFHHKQSTWILPVFWEASVKELETSVKNHRNQMGASQKCGLHPPPGALVLDIAPSRQTQRPRPGSQTQLSQQDGLSYFPDKTGGEYESGLD